MKHCPLCNTEYESTENFCKKDGTKLVEKSQPEGKKCSKCGKTYPSEAAFCMVCGLKLVSESEKPTCSNCGAELPDGALFCMKCGTKASPVDGNEDDIDSCFEKAIKDCNISFEEAIYINAVDKTSPMKRDADELLMLVKFRKLIEQYPQSIYLY